MSYTVNSYFNFSLSVSYFSTELIFYVFDGETLIAIGDKPRIMGRYSGDVPVCCVGLNIPYTYIILTILFMIIHVHRIISRAIILHSFSCYCRPSAWP